MGRWCGKDECNYTAVIPNLFRNPETEMLKQVQHDNMGEQLRMNYQEALNYILSFADYERLPRSAVVFDLRRIEELLLQLGNPHLGARAVHIAGTKGKGSTSAMIASILSTAGYRTGLYTSPHLHSLRERINIDGQPISEGELIPLVEKIKPYVEVINRENKYGQLTTFELLTALAFIYFKEKKVDFQVLEVGLGGRLDATNVVKSEVCVITSISFDHMEVLGNTLTQIATEKTGIIKPGSIVITSPQFPEAAEVIERVCWEKEVRLIKVGKEVTWQKGIFNLSGQSFRVKGMRDDYELTIPLLGEHQLDNAATAVAAVEALADFGIKVSPQNIAQGLARTQWQGRLQILKSEPLLLVDSAHNADSARKLGIALRHYFNFDQLILILGASQDKDITGIVAELAPFPSKVIVTSSHHPRAVATSILVAEFSKWGIVPMVAEKVANAVDLALKMAKPRDLICATGSIFVVAEAIEYIKGINPEQYPYS